MSYKNIKLFLKKYFIFLIPLFLFIIYLFYPLLQTTLKSFSETLNLKKVVTNEVLYMYESRKAEKQRIMSAGNIQQCQDKCPESNDANYKSGLLSDNYYCKLECEHNAEMYEPSFFLRSTFSNEQKNAIIAGQYHGFDIYQIKNSLFVVLFSRVFGVLLPSYYEECIENFKFQNIVIIILILILYYILVIGINNIKILEKKK